MPSEFDFEQKLAYSRGIAANTHPDTIRRLLGASCVSVSEPSLDMNKKGIDFIATIRRGATLNIDIKTRELGCSKWWKSTQGKREPELALEIWSVIPDEFNPKGKAGWTLDESKETDYTLHVYDRHDSMEVFLLPFQLLRMAFRRKLAEWEMLFKVDKQTTKWNGREWKSECVFVPATTVIAALTNEMRRL